MNHYLKDNMCIQLKPDQYLDHCFYYSTPNFCIGCQEGYYPTDGKCVQVLALDCNTYESYKACSSCKPGFGLKIIGDVKSCILVNQPNCLLFNQEFPWECLIC